MVLKIDGPAQKRQNLGAPETEIIDGPPEIIDGPDLK